MSSYIRFVLKHKNDDTPWGDVARDVLQDSGINHSWNWKQFDIYIKNLNPCEAAYSIMLEMKDAYKQTTKRKSPLNPT